MAEHHHGISNARGQTHKTNVAGKHKGVGVTSTVREKGSGPRGTVPVDKNRHARA